MYYEQTDRLTLGQPDIEIPHKSTSFGVIGVCTGETGINCFGNKLVGSEVKRKLFLGGRTF